MADTLAEQDADMDFIGPEPFLCVKAPRQEGTSIL